MNSGASEHFKRYLRRSQSGQSLVILAIGFFALVGFVGIVTDVSILFVRYSTLRRAVDAAAVAAAGQMRRVEAASAGEDQAQSYANMGLAARQFIEFYGLNPSSVTVETCHVQNTPSVTPDPDLCTEDERKLVRVTAQIDSPTTFFSLFGFDTIRLQAESISETAVLDLIFIMDVSESMLNETTYTDWETVPQSDGTTVNYGRRYLPPVLKWPDGANYNNMALAWQTLSSTSNEVILQNVLDVAGTGSLVAALAQNPGMEKVRTYGSGNEPRRECTVRFWPGSALKGDLTNPAIVDQYISDLGGVNNFKSWFGLSTGDDVYSDSAWYGFVPMYDYYGCCNDPNGDWDMSDLICQPFRRAREASIDFMGRLDFIRGDRVAIVTFDRRATLMDPDPSDVDPTDPTRSDTRDAMIYSQDIAERVMRERVGVRTEDSFYADSESPLRDGRWDTLRDNGVPRDLGYYATTPIQSIIDHPVRNACPYDSAIVNYPYSLYRNADDTAYRSPFYIGVPEVPGGIPVALDEVDTLPSWFESAVSTNGGAGSLRDRVITGSGYDFVYRLERSYEYRGSCAGTNIGEGLGKASETLGRLGRREGAVWIMVLLSDGAAGASSSVWRNGTLAQPARPYNPSGIGNGTQPSTAGLGQQYGSYGLCPYGADLSTAGELLQDRVFPYCSDVFPDTRHYCSDDNVGVETAEQRGPNRIDVADESSCETFYDVDDYARDWADYIAVRGINVYQQSVSGIDVIGNDADTLLPTIFTIGFGLEFNDTTGCLTNAPQTGDSVYDCNIESYLGEELLRYIADAGDNFRIDSDYWQQEMGYRIPNRVSDLAPGQDPDWGVRGPCEQPSGTRGAWAPLTPGEDCGNYFSAASGSSADLNAVFAEIASRMFTRLAG